MENEKKPKKKNFYLIEKNELIHLNPSKPRKVNKELKKKLKESKE
ncbi:hypothetical protein LCGC14_1325720 [marine sediment metagenome]|uniref:Uncharacterized protein n=1 Tax=marine sediment metagenome TaxID=412755 RepID=A0A0F9L408_9ZZZZ